jgi:hypothetical protein
LLLAVRGNDLKGHDRSSSFDVVRVNGDPLLQMEHCLRAPDEDEPDGTERALGSCRGFIAGRVAEALTGLGPDGFPDPQARLILPVWLDVRGEDTQASLPLYYVRMGQARLGIGVPPCSTDRLRQQGAERAARRPAAHERARPLRRRRRERRHAPPAGDGAQFGS